MRTPKRNKRVEYSFITSVFVKDKKTGKVRKLLDFPSDDKKAYLETKKSFENDRQPKAILGKGKSISIIGATTKEPIDAWKIKETTTLRGNREVKPRRLQQVWILAEVSIQKLGQRKPKYVGQYYGYSKMGGSEKEAIDYIFGIVRQKYNLGSGDNIYPQIIAKGIMEYR
jgi:hypothetical protein